MRTHSRFGLLAPRPSAEVFHRVVRAEYLAAARLDPGYAVRVDADGILDLVFSHGGEVVPLPFFFAQGRMLWFPERSALLWPSWLPHLRTELAHEIEDYVEPWLRSLVVARCANEETIRLFGDDAKTHDLFLRCRQAGFIGAASTETVMRSLAPYAYALRFAAGKNVAIADRDGANGAALLARVASRVDLETGDADLESLASRWFGPSLFARSISGTRYDVAIGNRADLEAEVTISLDAAGSGRRIDVATPIPPSVMVSFDPEDGSAERSFTVRAPAVAIRPPGVPEVPVVAGSAGRIALVVRDDYIGADDADTDAAMALAQRLRDQGFAPAIVPANHLNAREFDLLHVFGLRCAASFKASLDSAGNPPLPLVVTPYADDPAGDAPWAEAIERLSLENASDDFTRSYYFSAVAERNLEAAGAPSRGAGKLEQNSEVLDLVRRAHAMVVSSDAEAARLRGAFAYEGPCRLSPAVFAVEAGDAEVGALTGLGDFVLVHAPIEPRCNQFKLVRAAGALGYPIVLTGSVRDVHYYGEVVAALGDGGCWLPAAALTSRELSSLYRRARVFADASWSAGGLYRLARAAAGGAALVAPASGYAQGLWPGVAAVVDPASAESVTTGLRQAWEAAPTLGAVLASETLRLANPFKALQEVLAAYQAAAESVARQVAPL